MAFTGYRPNDAAIKAADAEIERLAAENKQWQVACRVAEGTAKERQQEVKRLKAELKTLEVDRDYWKECAENYLDMAAEDE